MTTAVGLLQSMVLMSALAASRWVTRICGQTSDNLAQGPWGQLRGTPCEVPQHYDRPSDCRRYSEHYSNNRAAHWHSRGACGSGRRKLATWSVQPQMAIRHMTRLSGIRQDNLGFICWLTQVRQEGTAQLHPRRHLVACILSMLQAVSRVGPKVQVQPLLRPC